MRERLQSAGLLLTAALAACDDPQHVQVEGPREMDANRCLTSASNQISDEIGAIFYKEPVMPDPTTVDVMLRNNIESDDLDLIYRYQGELDFVELDKGIARIEEITSKEGVIHGELMMYATRDCEEVVGFANCILTDPEVCGENKAHAFYFDEGVSINEMMEY